jgi:hypothetical protein
LFGELLLEAQPTAALYSYYRLVQEKGSKEGTSPDHQSIDWVVFRLLKILRDAEISREDFIELVQKT